MRWEYVGSGLALLGIGISMMLALPPPWWPAMPRWMIRLGLLVGLALIIFGTLFTAMGIWPDVLRPRLWPLSSLALGIFIAVISTVWLLQFPGHAPTRKIISEAPPHIANRTDRFGDISLLNDSELRSLTSQFAKEMRSIESNFDKLPGPPLNYPNMTLEEKTKEFERLQQARNELKAQKALIFRNNLYMDMTAILNELEGRLQRAGILIPPDKPMAPLVGNLAGVSPDISLS